MSTLAEAIVSVLSRRQSPSRLILTVATVDKVLVDLGIPTSASKGVPVGLRVKRLSFNGTKRLAPENPDAAGWPVEVVRYPASESVSGNEPPQDGIDDPSEEVLRALVPFTFEWEPQEGVNGIGSGRNLRGKSTVINVLLWSLSGRFSEFSPDIRRWIEHVEVDWSVGTETLRVAFDADSGVASNGTVTVLGVDGSAENVVARFDGDSFEDAMSSVMLNRLRLEPFTVSQAGKSVSHRWSSYVNALWVRPKYLKSIIGKEPVLSIRLMQMFIGTDWVPVLATTSTIAGMLAAEHNVSQQRRKTATDVVGVARNDAQKRADALRVRVGALPTETPDLAKMISASARVSVVAREIHELEMRLINESVAADTIRLQLKAAQARRNTGYEHDLLTKFFHQMEPTVCPRCTAKVTTERRAAESEEHKCSVCTSDLHLDALGANVVVASSVDGTIISTLMSAGSVLTAEPDEPEPRNEIDALTDALRVADEGIPLLRARLANLVEARDAASREAEISAVSLAAAQTRQRLEVELARAEGAVEALAEPVSALEDASLDPTQLAVAAAAETVLRGWVKYSQDPLLAKISEEIERLTVSFGGDSLSHFRLDGAANMTMRKGGDPARYGQLTPGEQLRVKIATVIALIKHGYAGNIGRHPGFLLIDSPAAEEMPDGDLATMVASLNQVAADAPMQIIVATRSTGPLVELLPEVNRIIAKGNGYVW